MSTSDWIIQIIDDLCNKYGVVVDWNADNNIAWIQELQNKIVNYETASSIAWIFISIIIVSSIGGVLLWMTKKNFCGICEFFPQLFILWMIIAIIGFVVCCAEVFDLIRCIEIPESVVFSYIQNYLKISG